MQNYKFARASGFTYYYFPTLNEGSAAHAFFTKPKNSSAPEQSLKKIFRGAVESLVTLKQVHGSDIIDIKNPAGAPRGEISGDSVTTNVPGVAVGVRTADCVPILLSAGDGSAVAAVHAGWKGTLAGITELTVRRLEQEYGAKPDTLRAAIGPAILSCCYEVGADVAEQYFRAFQYFGEVYDTWTRRLDLVKANTIQLTHAGVRPDNIQSLDLCTRCNPALFYSRRREGPGVGFMLSLIALQKQEGVKTGRT